MSGLPERRQASAPLVLVGDMGDAMGVAVEMVRGQETTISVGRPSCEHCGIAHPQTGRDLVYVNMTVNVPDVVARLRGDAMGGRGLLNLPDFQMAVAALVGARVTEVERELILRTLEHCEGNRTNAATMLGISIRTMRNKLRAFEAEGALDARKLLKH